MAKERAGMKKEQGSRTRDPQKTRQNIVDAATRLFSQKGVAATSIRDIATEANESLSSIYYYFDDKDDLFRTILLESALAGLVPVMQAEQSTKGDSLDRLRKLMASYIEFISENTESSMMLIRGLLRVLEHENLPLVSLAADRFKVIEGILKEGEASGELAKTDERIYAYTFIGMVMVFFFANIMAKNVDDWPYKSFTSKQFLEFTDRFLLGGLKSK